jgi:hypothetical protein
MKEEEEEEEEEESKLGDKRWPMATVGVWFMRGMRWFLKSTPGWGAGG